MKEFVTKVTGIASHYPQLDAGDKLLIRQQAEAFADDYFRATGEEAVPSIVLLEFFHQRIEVFGIEIPVIAHWIKEDESLAKSFLEERKETLLRNK